jgi:hypothetical protein
VIQRKIIAGTNKNLTTKLCGVNEAQHSERPNERITSGLSAIA